jgi:hypothetical protein
MDDATRKALNERYVVAAHAMQTGVALEQVHNPGPTLPKHLRVGINSALVNQAALARLLIDIGIITEEEYLKALAEEMERERDRYEEHLGVKLA